MISIGNLDIDKLYVGNDEVEKIYLGNDLVWQHSVAPVNDTILNLSTPSQIAATLNINKTDTTPTEIYLNNTLTATSTTSGTQDISITIPSGTSTLKISGGEFYFDGHCLGSSANNVAVSQITFGSNYGTNIGQNAFRGGTGLTSIIIPDNVTNIGAGAFRTCTSLTSVTIGTGVTTIGSGVFYDCTNLTEINYNAINVTTTFASFSTVFRNVGTAGNGITVTFGDSVQSIPAYLFSVEDTAPQPNITSVTIGSGVTTIGGRAFNSCGKLSQLNWNTNLITDMTYNNGAFANAGISGSGITVTFGNNVTRVPSYLFSVDTTSPGTSAPYVTNVIMGNSITSIGNGAFSRFNGLTSITIPDSVTSIGTSAFSGCSGLTGITVQATTPPTLTNTDVFNNTNNCPIYVPASSVTAYQTETNWSVYSSRIQAISV